MTTSARHGSSGFSATPSALTSSGAPFAPASWVHLTARSHPPRDGKAVRNAGYPITRPSDSSTARAAASSSGEVGGMFA